MAEMTLRRWFVAWALVLGCIAAGNFWLSGAPDEPLWLRVLRWLVGFSVVPLALGALFTFTDRGSRWLDRAERTPWARRIGRAVAARRRAPTSQDGTVP